MDLGVIAKQAVDVAFAVGDSALEAGTLHIGKTQTYDFDTDKNTLSAGNDVTVKGVFYREAQAQGMELTNQLANFLIRGSDVPQRVREADTFSRDKDSSVWQIDDVEYVPTDAVCILKLRK
jgi:hypothetical protein